MFYGYSELVKVRLSMTQSKKAEEKVALEASNEKLREQGVKLPRTEEEVKEVLAKKAAKK